MFNVNYEENRFSRYLRGFIDDNNLFMADQVLPLDTFTYLSPAHDSTKWLDHVICTRQTSELLCNFKIEYELCLFDHFPISFELITPSHSINESCDSKEHLEEKFVYWSKMSQSDLHDYKTKLEYLITSDFFLNNEIFFCTQIFFELKILNFEKVFSKINL